MRGQIAQDSDSQLILAMGTIYPLLARLEKTHLSERVEATSIGNITYCYHITKQGRECLARELRRLERIARQARYKLGEHPFAA